MSWSSCRDQQNRRARLLKLNSPGRQSLAQSLISVVTGVPEPSETGESGEGSMPWESSGSSSEESIPGSLRSPSTHSWEGVGEEWVAESTPPPPPPPEGCGGGDKC